MPEEKTLAVDFTKENALSQILSRAPIVSSQKADWDSIHVQYH